MILLMVLHIAGTLVALAYIADHHECRNILQLPTWILAAAAWPAWVTVRAAQVALREYRALGDD